MNQTGWICPKCSKALAPWVSACDCKTFAVDRCFSCGQSPCAHTTTGCKPYFTRDFTVTGGGWGNDCSQRLTAIGVGPTNFKVTG